MSTTDSHICALLGPSEVLDTGHPQVPDPSKRQSRPLVHARQMTILTCAAVFWLVILCIHDLRSHTLPNHLTIPVGGASIAMGVNDTHVALSIVALGSPYLLAALLGACGGGDLKLAVGLGGMITDPVQALLVGLAAAVTTLVAGLARPRQMRGTPIAHGPALALAAVALGGIWV